MQQFESIKPVLEEAENHDLIIIPTGLSLDDLEPTVLLAHELVKA